MAKTILGVAPALRIEFPKENSAARSTTNKVRSDLKTILKTTRARLHAPRIKQMEGSMAELMMLALLGVFVFCATMSVLAVLD